LYVPGPGEIEGDKIPDGLPRFPNPNPILENLESYHNVNYGL